MKKKITAIFLALTISLCLLSCNNSKFTKKQSEKQVFTPALDTQKSLSLNIIGVYGNFEALEQLIADFNQYYPNVNISYEYASNLESTTLVRCATKDNVDMIFIYTSEHDYFYKTLSEKYLVNFDQTNIDLSNLDKRAIDNTRVDGRLTFLPIYVQSTGLLVNTTLLEKYNISIPENKDDFEKACNILLSKNITPIYALDTISSNFFLNHMIFDLMKNQNRDKIIDDFNNGIFHKEIMEDSMKIYNEWIAKGYIDFSGNELPNSYDALIMRFLEGDLPFAFANSDTISGMKKREARSAAFKNKPFKYTYLPSPTGDDGFEEVYFPSLLFGLCNVSENLDYANEFMRFMTSVQGLNTMVTVKGMPSTYKKTGDYRFSYFDNLKDSERYYIGENGLTRKALNAFNYSLPNQKHDENSVEGTERDFISFMTKERKNY